MGEGKFDLKMVNAMLAQLAEVTERRAAENRRTMAAQQKGSTSGEGRRMQQLREDYLLVVAIDFGTTFSGYAFSFKGDKTNIKINTNWGSNLGFSSFKTATCLLLDENKNFRDFGYEAQGAYASLMDAAKKYYFFEKFKMVLHNSKKLTSDTPISSTDGKTLPAIDVFAHSLKYLKNHCLEAIKKASETKEAVDTKYIRWVITVPAIWSDASKQFMRQVAVKAGFIEDEESDRLVIALEPEAASLYCRTLTIDSFATVDAGTKKERPNLPTGTKYLVLDAGGGTLDVTCHEIQSDGTVKELHFATGGAMGGMRVNDQYIQLLCKLFGSSFIKFFQTDSPVEWLNMMSTFEFKKRAVTDGGADLVLQLSYAFGTKYQSKTGKLVDDVFKPSPVEGITFSNGTICIRNSVAKGLFNDVIIDIVKHIYGLMKTPKIGDVKYFFLVGGFNDCTLLRATIMREFGKRVKIMVPNEAIMAVVKGAVMFGHHPTAVASRISALTYGVNSATSFDKRIHDRSKMTVVKGREIIADSFEKFISKGDEVPDGFTKTSSFSPLHAEQDAAQVIILTSTKRDVLYADEDDVKIHGVVEVNWPGTGKDRKLNISMTFGGTEIHVEAVAFPGGDKATSRVKFLSA